VDTDGLNRLVAKLRSVRADTHPVEVKSAVGKLPKSLAETLSAFSNSAGGTVILGLDEGTGFRPAPGFDALRQGRRSLVRARTISILRCGLLLRSFRLRVPRSW
jgi:hypothetical protein